MLTFLVTRVVLIHKNNHKTQGFFLRKRVLNKRWHSMTFNEFCDFCKSFVKFTVSRVGEWYSVLVLFFYSSTYWFWFFIFVVLLTGYIFFSKVDLSFNHFANHCFYIVTASFYRLKTIKQGRSKMILERSGETFYITFGVLRFRGSCL